MDSLLVAIFIIVIIIYTCIIVGFGILLRGKYEKFLKWLESLKGEKKE